MMHHTSGKGVHDPPSPVGNAISAVKWQIAVVCTIDVARRNARRVEAGVAVEATISRQNSQHAARPVITGHVCMEKK